MCLNVDIVHFWPIVSVCFSLNEYQISKRTFKSSCRAKQLQKEQSYTVKLLKCRTDPKKFWSCTRSAKIVNLQEVMRAIFLAQSGLHFKSLFEDTDDGYEMQQRGIFENLNEQRGNLILVTTVLYINTFLNSFP